MFALKRRVLSSSHVGLAPVGLAGLQFGRGVFYIDAHVFDVKKHFELQTCVDRGIGKL